MEKDHPILYSILDKSAEKAVRDPGSIIIKFLAAAPEYDKEFEANENSNKKQSYYGMFGILNYNQN